MGTYTNTYTTHMHVASHTDQHRQKTALMQKKTGTNSLILLPSLADQDEGPLVDIYMYNMDPPAMILDAQSFQ